MVSEPNVGDAVQLNSGGPWMTIRSVNKENNFCTCNWFSTTNELKQETFLTAQLKKSLSDLLK